MNHLLKYAVVAVLTLLACVFAVMAGTKRIETGEVGVRLNLSKEIEDRELQPGSWNQNIIGSILTFPVKDITVSVLDKRPLTADNSALEDFDVVMVYNINPQSAAELWSTKAKSFHVYSNGDWYLMYDYLGQLVNATMNTEARKYKALEINDNRQAIESGIMSGVRMRLEAEGLAQHIKISAVQVRSIQPNRDILDAATAYVKSQNALRVKENEVAIAKKEAERILALNSPQNISYMQAEAQRSIARGVENCKSSVVVPYDFKGIINVPR